MSEKDERLSCVNKNNDGCIYENICPEYDAHLGETRKCFTPFDKVLESMENVLETPMVIDFEKQKERVKKERELVEKQMDDYKQLSMIERQVTLS